MSETTENRTGVAHRLLTYLEDTGEAPVSTTDGARVTIDLAIDIGNSETYALAVCDGKPLKPIRIPSIKSVRGASARQLLSDRQRLGDWAALAADEHVVTVDGIDRFVGGLAITSSAYPTSARGSEERYGDGWNLDFLYAAVGVLTRGAAHVTARVITALPYGLWPAHQSGVTAALRRTHRYSYNGEAKTLAVTSVTVEREGHTAWWALPPAWREAPVLILDWGGHTCNIVLVDPQGNVVPGRAMTQPVGCETILDDISTDLPRPLSIGERAALLEILRDGGERYLIPVDGQRLDVLPVARRRFADAARTFAQKLMATISPQDRAQIGTIALVGGTTYFAAAGLRERVPVQTLPKDHEFANLLGTAIRHGLIGPAKGKRGR